jgi:protein phosphatase
MKIRAHGLTNIGMKRKINQDAFLKDDAMRLYIVADGMGGHRGGEVASQLAVTGIQKFCHENIERLPPAEILHQGINLSGAEIHRMAAENDDLNGMGTTVMALFFRDDTVYVGQVGDSRAYLMAGNGIWQITEDHSLLNEEIRAGRISATEAANYQFKNVITRSVGYEERVAVDIYRRKICPGDIYLLCSDGLSGCVEIGEILDRVKKHGAIDACGKLVELANSRGGDDNITLIICEVFAD